MVVMPRGDVDVGEPRIHSRIMHVIIILYIVTDSPSLRSPISMPRMVTSLQSRVTLELRVRLRQRQF